MYRPLNIILVLSIILSGCAYTPQPVRSPYLGHDTPAAQCADLFAALDQSVKQAGVRDPGEFRLENHPYLRTNRFLASFATESGELVVLNVVRATEQVDFYSALSHAEDSVHLLDGSTQLPTSNRVKIRPVVRVSHSLPKGIVHAAEQKAHSSKILVEAIKQHGAKALYRIEVASSAKPLDFLIERSAEFDLLVVGATKVRFLENMAVGPFSSQIAMRSDCSVAIVRVAPTVKKIMPI